MIEMDNSVGHNQLLVRNGGEATNLRLQCETAASLARTTEKLTSLLCTSKSPINDPGLIKLMEVINNGFVAINSIAVNKGLLTAVEEAGKPQQLPVQNQDLSFPSVSSSVIREVLRESDLLTVRSGTLPGDGTENGQQPTPILPPPPPPPPSQSNSSSVVPLGPNPNQPQPPPSTSALHNSEDSQDKKIKRPVPRGRGRPRGTSNRAPKKIKINKKQKFGVRDTSPQDKNLKGRKDENGDTASGRAPAALPQTDVFSHTNTVPDTL